MPSATNGHSAKFWRPLLGLMFGGHVFIFCQVYLFVKYNFFAECILSCTQQIGYFAKCFFFAERFIFYTWQICCLLSAPKNALGKPLSTQFSCSKQNAKSEDQLTTRPAVPYKSKSSKSIRTSFVCIVIAGKFHEADHWIFQFSATVGERLISAGHMTC